MSVPSLTRTVTPASESSCLMSRKLFKVPRRAFRHEKSSKCSRYWKHLCQWPTSATKPFVNIPKSGLERAFAFAQTVTPSKPLGVLDELLKNASVRDINVGADDTSSDSDVERDSKHHRTQSGRQAWRLHVMIDHLMVRGPKQNKHLWICGQCHSRDKKELRGLNPKVPSAPASDRGVHHLHTDTDLDRALVFHANELCVAGAQHHHGTMLLAALLDRWPAFCKMGWRKVPRDHGATNEWGIRNAGSKSEGSPTLRGRQLPPNSQPRDRV